jgi:hypothetical protein
VDEGWAVMAVQAEAEMEWVGEGVERVQRMQRM